MATAPATTTAPTATNGRLTAEVTSVELIPDRHAVVVHGNVFNGTSAIHTAIRLDADLRVDNVVDRRREVWCCEDLTTEAAVTALSNPQSFRFSAKPEPGRVTTVEPGANEPFSIVFPSIDDETLGKDLTGEVRMTEATRVPAQ